MEASALDPFACKVNWYVPEFVGVPLIWPALVSVNPGAGLLPPPARDHTYVPNPPLACAVVLYATPAVPSGRGHAEVMFTCCAFTVTPQRAAVVSVPSSLFPVS